MEQQKTLEDKIRERGKFLGRQIQKFKGQFRVMESWYDYKTKSNYSFAGEVLTKKQIKELKLGKVRETAKKIFTGIFGR